MFLGWSNGWWCEVVERYLRERERVKLYAVVCWEDLKQSEHLEDLGVKGKMIYKTTVIRGVGWEDLYVIRVVYNTETTTFYVNKPSDYVHASNDVNSSAPFSLYGENISPRY
jgi:hypothetical protein